jgi:hypothetical protein
MDDIMKKQIKKLESKKVILKDGKLFFSKETERKFFFFMTLIMLLIGVLGKLI